MEKVRAVNNPLTIIAIFAALAEIAGTVVLSSVDESLQRTFIWFVMGFPSFLVLLFFLTLNLNPRVLYAPSDFRDEENFINLIAGAQNVKARLNEMAEELTATKEQIDQWAIGDQAGGADREDAQLSQALEFQLRTLESLLQSARQEANSVASRATSAAHPQSGLQARILELLSRSDNPLTCEQLARDLGMSVGATSRAVDRLVDRSLVQRVSDGEEPRYTLP